MNGGPAHASTVSTSPLVCAVRFQEYGYGQMTVTGVASLAFDFVDIYGEVRDSFTIARTA